MPLQSFRKALKVCGTPWHAVVQTAQRVSSPPRVSLKGKERGQTTTHRQRGPRSTRGSGSGPSHQAHPVPSLHSSPPPARCRGCSPHCSVGRFSGTGRCWKAPAVTHLEKRPHLAAEEKTSRPYKDIGAGVNALGSNPSSDILLAA